MDTNRQFMYFTFSTPTAQQTTIQVTTLKGKVTFDLHKLDGDEETLIPCSGSVCNFVSEEKSSYLVYVKGTMKSV